MYIETACTWKNSGEADVLLRHLVHGKTLENLMFIETPCTWQNSGEIARLWLMFIGPSCTWLNSGEAASLGLSSPLYPAR